MNVHVELQIGQLIKGFFAEIAAIRLLACVYKNMVAQIAFLMETFATDITHEFFQITVSANMSLERG